MCVSVHEPCVCVRVHHRQIGRNSNYSCLRAPCVACLSHKAHGWQLEQLPVTYIRTGHKHLSKREKGSDGRKELSWKEERRSDKIIIGVHSGGRKRDGKETKGRMEKRFILRSTAKFLTGVGVIKNTDTHTHTQQRLCLPMLSSVLSNSFVYSRAFL